MTLLLIQACGEAAKETELPVRKPCNLERLYKDMPQDIRTDTPDMAFVNALCAGKADEVAALFREKKLFWNERPAIDAPYGRFEGLDSIHTFAEGFLKKFNATSATFTPVFQTIGGGRIALEGVFKFVVDEAIEEVPFFVITDLRTPKLLEEVRMYTHYSFIPGLTPYRKPIFKPAHYEMGDPGLLTGAMRAYYEALHHAPYCNPEKIHAAFADECIVGGYDPGAPLSYPRKRCRKMLTNSAMAWLLTFPPVSACATRRLSTTARPASLSGAISFPNKVSRSVTESPCRVAAPIRATTRVISAPCASATMQVMREKSTGLRQRYPAKMPMPPIWWTSSKAVVA